MYLEKIKVESIQKLESNIYLIQVFSPSISSAIKPGQFCNIKVSESDFPLLRRPFSVCDVEKESIYFMFDIHGEGTQLLSKKQPGDYLDVMGPLGKGFDLVGDYEFAVLIAGGIGAAPFPYLIKELQNDKNIFCFIGGRSKEHIAKYGMKNLYISTDDGSEGFHGTVVDLFKKELSKISDNKFRIFACGPTPMLRAIQDLAIQYDYDCQISTECAMACGFGICQGCPIEKADGDGYYLVCKDGPVFNAQTVKL